MPTIVSEWWSGLECKAKAIAAVLGLLGLIVSGAWFVDARYVTAEDFKQQQKMLQQDLTSLRIGQMQSDYRLLQKEKFALEQSEQQKGKLTELERERLKMVESDLANLSKEIDRLRLGNKK